MSHQSVAGPTAGRTPVDRVTAARTRRPTRLRRLASTVAIAATVTVGPATIAGPASAAGGRTAPAPPVHGAAGAAAWLSRQFTSRGDIPTTGSDAPDYSDTAQSVLALVAAGSESATVRSAMTFLRANVHHELTTEVGGAAVKSPGAIAFLLLDATATGGTGRDFGGVDLVTTLLATMRTSGSDTGLFGATAPTYDGAYRQGLSLAALAAAAATPSDYAPAVRWLVDQQCSSGGWEAYRSVTTACTRRDPKTYSGPDTNSTALAVEGLVAVHAGMTVDPLAFLLDAQDSDGGWGYYGGPSDADSTAVVRQALVALHKAHSHAVVKPGGTPLSALESFQITSGADAGALAYQPDKGVKSANLLATEQAGPALAGLAFPFPSASSPATP